MRPMVIATHSGPFHADDVLAVAMLRVLHPDAGVVRTRSNERLALADFLVDVGGEFDPSKGRFDHHQPEFSLCRPSGDGYASAGLVWATHGVEVVRSIMGSSYPGVDECRVAEDIDRELILHVDRADTGEAMGCPGSFGFSALIRAFNPTRRELANLARGSEDAGADPAQHDAHRDAPGASVAAFMAAVELAHQALVRLVEHAASRRDCEAQVLAAPQMEAGRVRVLAEPGLEWANVLCRLDADVRYVVFPSVEANSFLVRTVPVEPDSFVSRQLLPAAWAGLSGESLALATGVPDAVFCHRGRFICAATSRAGAIELARRALSHG